MATPLFPSPVGPGDIMDVPIDFFDKAVQSGITAGRTIPTDATIAANAVSSTINAYQEAQTRELTQQAKAQEIAINDVKLQQLQDPNSNYALEQKAKALDYARKIKLETSASELADVMGSGNPQAVKDALTSGKYSQVLQQDPNRTKEIYRQATLMGAFSQKELDDLLYKGTDSAEDNWKKKNSQEIQKLYAENQSAYMASPLSSSLNQLGYDYAKAVNFLEALPANEYDDAGKPYAIDDDGQYTSSTTIKDKDGVEVQKTFTEDTIKNLNGKYRLRDKQTGKIIPGLYGEDVNSLRKVQQYKFIDPALKPPPEIEGVQEAEKERQKELEKKIPTNAAEDFKAAGGVGTAGVDKPNRISSMTAKMGEFATPAPFPQEELTIQSKDAITQQRAGKLQAKAAVSESFREKMIAKGKLKVAPITTTETVIQEAPPPTKPPSPAMTPMVVPSPTAAPTGETTGVGEQSNLGTTAPPPTRVPAPEEAAAISKTVVRDLPPIAKANVNSRTVAKVISDPMLAKLSPLEKAVVAVESSGNRYAKNKGSTAEGYFQLTRAAAQDVKANKAIPEQNVQGGVAYLKSLVKRYDGAEIPALMAYNLGMGVVDRAINLVGSANYNDLVYALDYMEEQGLLPYDGKQTREIVKVGKEYPIKVMSYREAFTRA